jgi:phage host-nuclease inhibitor protein Gam
MPAKTTRIKAPVILTREEFEILVERVAIHTTRLRQAEANRDEEIQRVQAGWGREISKLGDYIKADVTLCEKYAEEHRAELLPGKAKSNETALARYGFRLGNRTVALLNRKCSWEAAVKLLKAFGYLCCLRTVEEVNKEAVLANTDDQGFIGLPASDEKKGRTNVSALGNIGLKINQSETFYIEPKIDGAVQVKAAS